MNATITARYNLRLVSVAELDALVHLQKEAMSDEQQPDLYVPLTKEEFQLILNGEGLLVGCYMNEDLVAFHCVYDPGDHPDHLGYDLGFNADQLHRAAHLEAACVHPQHRGIGLQTYLTTWLIQTVKVQGRHRYLLQTVSPDNVASIISTFRSGLSLLKYQYKYGRKKRFLFAIDLETASAYEEQPTYTRTLSDSMQAYQQLFEEGYHGIGYQIEDGSVQIRFSKPCVS